MRSKPRTRGFPTPGHDHASCVDAMLARADRLFAARGLRLTPLRRRVLEKIAGSHTAVGAYDLLDRLARPGERRLAPISVYRALDSLVDAGIVHRLESRNAYFACHAPHVNRQRHMALVCDACAKVVEVTAAGLYDSIDAASDANGFQLKSAVAEGSGLCATCRIQEPAS